MLTKIEKLSDLPASDCRNWYNLWVKENCRGDILDVGKSKHWDYTFPTIDINPDTKPTYIANIEKTHFLDNTFHVVLCNGIYEFVDNPQKMIDEVLRIAKQVAIFGFVGKDYKPYKKPWKFYEGKEKFPDNVKIINYDFDKEYHFIICHK